MQVPNPEGKIINGTDSINIERQSILWKMSMFIFYKDLRNSERRDSDPRHAAWEATTLPTELRSHNIINISN